MYICIWLNLKFCRTFHDSFQACPIVAVHLSDLGPMIQLDHNISDVQIVILENCADRLRYNR